MKKIEKMVAVFTSDRMFKVRVLNADGVSDEEIYNSEFIPIDNDLLGNVRCLNTKERTIDVYPGTSTTWIPVCEYDHIELFDKVVG